MSGATQGAGFGSAAGKDMRAVAVESATLTTRFAQSADWLGQCHALLDEIEQRVESTPEKVSGGGPIPAVQGIAGYAMQIGGQVQHLHARLAKLRDAL